MTACVEDSPKDSIEAELLVRFATGVEALRTPAPWKLDKQQQPKMCAKVHL